MHIAFIALIALFAVIAAMAQAASIESEDISEYGNIQAFLNCMGAHWAKHCGGQATKCAVQKNVRQCVESISCGGVSTHNCAHFA